MTWKKSWIIVSLFLLAAVGVLVLSRFQPSHQEKLDAQLFQAVSDSTGRPEELATIKSLIAQGANPNRRPRPAANAPDWEKEYPMTLLGTAVQGGSLPVIEMLLARGADPDAVCAGKRTVFAIAVEMGRKEIIETLLKHGAKLEVHDEKGYTPLLVASEIGRAPIVQILLDHHADVKARNFAGRTALRLVADAGKQEAATVLHKAGAKE